MSDPAPAVKRGVGALGGAARLAVAALALAALGCSVGQGTGEVESQWLFLDDCYAGEFRLRPNFFGAIPFDDTLTIRVQRGERDILVSDGFTMLVYNVAAVRSSALDTMLPLGLPVGVSPLGFPLPATPNPPAATMTLYLNNSCRSQNAVLHAVDGWVSFSQLFSGDPNEENSDDRITAGEFFARVVDPRHAVPDTDENGNPTFTYPEDVMSDVSGYFQFVFHRGTPAQPFP